MIGSQNQSMKDTMTFFPTRAFMAMLTIIALSWTAGAVTDRAHAKSDPDAEAFIQELGEQTVAVISDPARNQDEKLEEFRTLLVGNVDLRRFGRSALGPYSDTPTDKEFADYLDALEDYAVLILGSRFQLFENHTVKVTESEERGSGARAYVFVTTELRNPEQKLVGVIRWILIRDAGDYSIFDIVVQTPGESGTFSLLKTQRDEFTQVLSANGRRMSALIAYLRNIASNPERFNRGVTDSSSALTQ